jgi:hypothetical protein
MSTYAKTLEKAAKWASIEFGRLITVQTLRAKTKAVTHTHPRWFAMAYLHATGRYSQPQIAKALHLKDHTTVLYGLRRAHGHDGKDRNEPLWNKEQFKNMVKLDEAAFQAVTAEQIDEIGMDNLARFTNGSGWAA